MVGIMSENKGIELVNPYQVIKVFELSQNARRINLVDGTYVVTSEEIEDLKKKLLV